MEMPTDGAWFEYYNLINEEGYLVAHVLVDGSRYHLFPVSALLTLKWQLTTITTDQAKIVELVNNHPNPNGPLFKDDVYKNPALLITVAFWVCHCIENYIHHYNLKKCPVCGATGDVGGKAKYLETIACKLEKIYDEIDLLKGVHTMH